MKVAVIGTGRTGLVTAASLAEVGHSVSAIDTDRNQVARLREGIIGSYEPQLAESVRRNALELRLEFGSTLSDGIRGAEVVVLALNSPSNVDGITDMSDWATIAGRLSSLLRPYTVVVVAGTVRPGGTQLLRTILEEDGRRAGRDFDVVSIPSIHLRESVTHDARTPRRLVVGGASDHALRIVRRLLAPFVRGGAELVTVSERSAEAMSYAAAALRVTIQSLTREVADFCEEGGADIADVLREVTALASDELQSARLGLALRASPDGGDLRDARALAEMSTAWGCAPWTIDAALQQVPRTSESIMQRLRGTVGEELGGKRIALWGVAGWACDADGDDAVGIQVARALLSAGAHVIIHAPLADDRMRASLGDLADITDSPMAALASADALVVLCDLPAIRATDFTRVRRLMTRPIVIDPLWLWSQREMLDAGVYYNGTAPSRRDAERLSLAP